MKELFDFIKKYKIVFWVIVLLWLIFFIGVVFLSSDLSFSISPSMKLASIGVFGDSFNVLTSLFTGLAFSGVIISVILQTTELKEARNEFEKQSLALEKQQNEMVVQSFDNKFFQMLNLFNNVNNNLIYKTVTGKEVLTKIKKNFEYAIKDCKNLQHFQNIFDNFNLQYDESFKYYFINLYQILKYIDTHKNDELKAKEYTNIVRAQLSKNELILLFYNAVGVVEHNHGRYKELVEKYSFFEHLQFRDINPSNKPIINELLSKYEKNAFGNNTDLIEQISQS